LSLPADRASASAASPRGLHTYRARPPIGTVEDRPCACGGIVTANPEAPAYGVQAHNYTGRHKAWRANREEAA
jgi:hypothetical protein